MRVSPLLAGAALTLTLSACGQPDSLEYSRQQLELQQQRAAAERAEHQAASMAPFDRAVAASWRIFLAAVPLVALGIGIDAYRRRAVPLIRPDERGLLPVVRAEIQTGQLTEAFTAALAAFHTQQLAAAQRPVIDKLSITVKEPAIPQLRAVARSLECAESEAPALPMGTVDLSELVQTWRPSVDSITLAVGPGGVPYRVHARELCHVALAGATGGGKSNIMRLLLAQLTAAGAKVCLADPHFTPYDPESGDDWRPIAQRLHMSPAVKAADIRHMLAWMATDELPQRLERRYKGQHVGAPLFLAIDELPSIVKDVPEAPEHLGRLLREARKVNIFIIGAAQDFLVKTIGGAGAVRDCYRTAFYVGGDAQTARVLLDVRGSVDDGQLGQGLAMLRSKVTPTAQVVRVPYASNEAITRLLGGNDMAYGPTIDMPSPMPERSQPVAEPVAAYPALESAATVAPEAARVASLFLAGKTPAEIVLELHGIKSSQGAKYQQALSEVLDLVRQGVAPKAAGL